MTTRVSAARFLLLVPLVCAGSVSAEAACDWRGRRSLNSNVATRITFVNDSSTYRGIEWLGFDGQPKDYGRLAAGESKTISTFLTHPWMISDGPGNCLQIVMPRAGGSVVRLAGRPVKPAPGEEGGGVHGCPPGTVAVPETDNCVPAKRGKR